MGRCIEMTDKQYIDCTKITQGEWNWDGQQVVTATERMVDSIEVAVPTSGLDNRFMHDGQLIADAGTTAARTKKCPSQLADELEEACSILNALLNTISSSRVGTAGAHKLYCPQIGVDSVRSAREKLARIQGGAA